MIAIVFGSNSSMRFQGGWGLAVVRMIAFPSFSYVNVRAYFSAFNAIFTKNAQASFDLSGWSSKLKPPLNIKSAAAFSQASSE
jgi:hypothetical protein